MDKTYHERELAGALNDAEKALSIAQEAVKEVHADHVVEIDFAHRSTVSAMAILGIECDTEPGVRPVDVPRVKELRHLLPLMQRELDDGVGSPADYSRMKAEIERLTGKDYEEPHEFRNGTPEGE